MTLYIILALIAAALLFLFLKARQLRRMPEVPQSHKILTLTRDNFSRQISSGVTLVDFWAAWCMPCKMMAPVLNELAVEVGDKARVAKLNVEEEKQISAKYKVRSIPTLILFKNGREVDRIVGVKTKDFLIRKIEMLKYS